MKKLFIFLACAQAFGLFAQENPVKEINSEVEQVTVFFANAQITRQKSLSVEPGKTSLKFQNLSPYINPKSVQVKVDGSVTVLSVNHQLNYLDDMEKPRELSDLETKYKSVEGKIKVEQAHLYNRRGDHFPPGKQKNRGKEPGAQRHKPEGSFGIL